MNRPAVNGTARTAACNCGQLSATVAGGPVRVSICHCLACQRRTGSVFGTQARFHASRVTVHGRSTAFSRVGESGGRTTYHFCPDCGSTVYYRSDHEPALVAVPVGALADPAFPPPTMSYFERRRHAWLPLPARMGHED